MIKRPILEVRNLCVDYRTPRGRLRAVHSLDFEICAGEVLGLIGESGCGKSTVGKSIAKIIEFSGGRADGQIVFGGEDVARLSGKALRNFRKSVQIIFQDPVSALNPRRKIGDLIEEALILLGGMDAEERRSRVREVLAEVGLDPDVVTDRYSHEFSGGQCQRINIARAIAVEPKLLICDEAVSALDVSVQAQILNLLDELRVRRNLAMLFISHDMAVVKNISDRILVMYLGRNMELGDAETICHTPKHPYTAALIDAVPHLDAKCRTQPDRATLKGDIPSQFNPPSGCPLHTRCPNMLDLCVQQWPDRSELTAVHWLHCHNPVSR